MQDTQCSVNEYCQYVIMKLWFSAYSCCSTVCTSDSSECQWTVQMLKPGGCTVEPMGNISLCHLTEMFSLLLKSFSKPTLSFTMDYGKAAVGTSG